jgi:hypothetical protein
MFANVWISRIAMLLTAGFVATIVVIARYDFVTMLPFTVGGALLGMWIAVMWRTGRHSFVADYLIPSIAGGSTVGALLVLLFIAVDPVPRIWVDPETYLAFGQMITLGAAHGSMLALVAQAMRNWLFRRRSAVAGGD